MTDASERPAIWYRLNAHLDIEAVPVIRWTKNYLWLATGRQVQRETGYEEYFPVWKRAREQAVKRAEAELAASVEGVTAANKRLAAVLRLPKEPPED